MDFDTIHDRRGTHSMKWDDMEQLFGISPDDGLAMWVADMDFRSPRVVRDALQDMVDHGIFGYYADFSDYHDAIGWWMQNRHGWTVEPDRLLSACSLDNAICMTIDALTDPGDGICIMSPVYHAFHAIIGKTGRKVVQLPMQVADDGRYGLDIAGWDAAMTGTERALLLCSPHNPGGRVWTRDELAALADFATRHDLVLISDEVHFDMVYPGNHHIPTALIDGVADRLVTLTSASKVLYIPGARISNIIAANDDFHRKLKTRIGSIGVKPSNFSMNMVAAAYSPAGAEWVDALVAYLDGNRKLLDAGLAAIPGLRSMPLEATYLSWVDFSGTGMDWTEVSQRVAGRARIAAQPGQPFGTGGESCFRLNIGTPRANVAKAIARLQDAFSDLQ